MSNVFRRTYAREVYFPRRFRLPGSKHRLEATIGTAYQQNSTVVVTDDFNRTNSPGTLGASWDVSTTNIGVSGNELYNNGGQAGTGRYIGPNASNGTSMYSQLVWTVQEAGVATAPGGPAVMVPPVGVGEVGTGSFYVLNVGATTHDSWTINRKNTGSTGVTRLGAIATTTAVAAGDTLRLEYEASTGDLVGYLNGVEKIRRASSLQPLQEVAERGVGVRLEASGSSAYRFDNFQAGLLPTGSGARTITPIKALGRNTELDTAQVITATKSRIVGVPVARTFDNYLVGNDILEANVDQPSTASVKASATAAHGLSAFFDYGTFPDDGAYIAPSTFPRGSFSFRTYFRLASTPTTFLHFAIFVSGIDQFRVAVSIDQLLTLSTTNVGEEVTGGVTIPTGQWARVDVRWNRSGPKAQADLYVGANLEGTTPDETITLSAPAFIMGGASWVPNFGYNNGGESDLYLDEVVWLPGAYRAMGSYGSFIGERQDVAQPITAQTSGGGHNVAVGQVSETDTSQTVTHSKRKALGQPSETDLAQTHTRRKSKTLGQDTEANTSQPVTRSKRKTLGQDTETDLSQGVTHSKSRTLGEPSELDTPQVITRRKSRTVAQVTETDRTWLVTRRLSQVSETDLAQTITRRKSRTTTQTTETDLSQGVSHSKSKSVVQTTEADLSQTITRLKSKGLVQDAETGLAQPAGKSKSRVVAQDTETDLSQGVTRLKAKTVGQDAETNTTQPVLARKSVTLGQVTETDTSQSFTHRKSVTLTQVTASGTAQVFTRVKSKTIGQVTELYSVTYAAEVLTDVPLRYYRVGEASGTVAADGSGNGADGTYVGGTLGVTGLLTGDANTSVTFSGAAASSRIDMPDAVALDVTNITVECWYKWAGGGASPNMIGRDNSSGSNRSYQFRPGTVILFLTGGAGAGTWTLSDPAGDHSDSQVHHQVATYDGTTIRLYTDGVEVTNLAKTSSLQGANYGGCIGARTASQNGYPGTVDEVAIYDHALTPARVTAHYAAGTGTGGVSGALALRAVKSKTVGQVVEGDVAQTLTRTKTKIIGQNAETDLAQTITVTQTGGGFNIAVNQSSETDVSQSVTRLKTKSLAQTSETDSAQLVTRQLRQVTETDVAQSITHSKSKSLGQNLETELSQATTKLKSKSLSQTSEADLSQPVARSKSHALTQATETDLARSVVKSVAQARETELAQAVTHLKTRSVATVTETDIAQITTRSKSRTLTQATETDSSTAITKSKRHAVGQVSEVDLAQTVSRAGFVGTTLESDLTQPITRRKSVAIGQATGALGWEDLESWVDAESWVDGNTEFAIGVTFKRSLSAIVNTATESDTSQATTHRKARAVVQVTETDSSTATTKAKRHAAGQVTETDLARSVRRSVTQASEIDTAQSITHRKTRTVTQVAETELAQGVSHAKVKALTQPLEINAPQTVTRSKRRSVGQATETDLSQSFRQNIQVQVGTAIETDLSQVVGRRRGVHTTFPVETETAISVSARKSRAVQQSGETDSVGAVGHSKSISLGVSTDVETPQIVTLYKKFSISVEAVTETDFCAPITSLKSVTLAQLVELDTLENVAVVLGVIPRIANARIRIVTQSGKVQIVTKSSVVQLITPGSIVQLL